MPYLLLDSTALESIKADYDRHDSQVANLVRKLKAKADTDLSKGPFSVTYKRKIPPSGDRHDYMSLSTYFWPAAGNEYISRDGYINPEVYGSNYDLSSYNTMSGAVQELSLAFYFTLDNKYAAQAARLLKTWYLEPTTRMNPNLNYGQGVPGKSSGNPYGIIDMRDLPKIIDAAILLYDNSGYFTARDMDELKSWFSDYLAWLSGSELGYEEDHAKNNHGEWFDAQVVACEIFLGRNMEAMERMNRVTKARIASQMDENGKLKNELARTRPLHYSLFALSAFVTVARLATNIGLDLWNYQAADDQGIRKALDYLIPYIEGTRTLEQTDVAEVGEHDSNIIMLRWGAIKYDDCEYMKAADILQQKWSDDLINLYVPRKECQEQ